MLFFHQKAGFVYQLISEAHMVADAPKKERTLRRGGIEIVERRDSQEMNARSCVACPAGSAWPGAARSGALSSAVFRGLQESTHFERPNP